jgi:hypothetical protein
MSDSRHSRISASPLETRAWHIEFSAPSWHAAWQPARLARPGLLLGTTPYTTCVQREAEARRRGRLGPNYDETLIARDAQEDCAAYGVERGTPVFQQCVQREISYRRPN